MKAEDAEKDGEGNDAQVSVAGSSDKVISTSS
jgi:hypothetical protein